METITTKKLIEEIDIKGVIDFSKSENTDMIVIEISCEYSGGNAVTSKDKVTSRYEVSKGVVTLIEQRGDEKIPYVASTRQLIDEAAE